MCLVFFVVLCLPSCTRVAIAYVRDGNKPINELLYFFVFLRATNLGKKLFTLQVKEAAHKQLHKKQQQLYTIQYNVQYV